MARDILCIPCAKEFIAASKKHDEPFRMSIGRARAPYECDRCVPAAAIAQRERCAAVTTHPAGPHVVMPWESEFLTDVEEGCEP